MVKNNFLKVVIFVGVFAFLYPHLWAAELVKLKQQELCGGKIQIQTPEIINFSELEKTFLCGETQSEAWNYIPLSQRKFHMKTFLQERAFHRPVFSEFGDTLLVNVGETTRILSIEVKANPTFKAMKKKRFILHEKMTPKKINELEEWILGRVQSEGYPCPKLKTQANIDNGEVKVDLDYGSQEEILSVTQESLAGFGTGTLRRFDAFQMGKLFNDQLLDLSSRRILNDGVLQSSHFNWNCETLESGKGVDLYQRVFAGKPRLFTVSVGADTEEYGILKSSWKHTRLGSKASKFDASLTASYKRQSLDVSTSWYAFNSLSRWYILPSIKINHERESEYHFTSIDTRFALAGSYDNQSVGMKYSFGPNLNYNYTFRGAQEGLTRFLTLQYDYQLKSHDYEYWITDPRSGYQISLGGDFSSKSLLSELSAQRFKAEGHYYFNIKGYDPPLFVLGVRGGVYTTYLNNNSNNLDKLPPNYKYYLGGSQNLRGFNRKELADEGAFSAAFVGTELRFAHALPLWIEPLLFFDVGVLGDRYFQFHAPVYFSPGVGFRVASPIGTFRTTFSQGMKVGGNDGDPNNTHFQFFISFGEEF